VDGDSDNGHLWMVTVSQLVNGVVAGERRRGAGQGGKRGWFWWTVTVTGHGGGVVTGER